VEQSDFDTPALDGMLPWSNKLLYVFPQLNYTRKAKSVAKSPASFLL